MPFNRGFNQLAKSIKTLCAIIEATALLKFANVTLKYETFQTKTFIHLVEVGPVIIFGAFHAVKEEHSFQDTSTKAVPK